MPIGAQKYPHVSDLCLLVEKVLPFLLTPAAITRGFACKCLVNESLGKGEADARGMI